MNKLNYFDVIIVYSEAITKSVFDTSSNNQTPFLLGSDNEFYNTVYGYFLEVCQRMNLKVAFATSADIVGAGYCHGYWIFKNKKWLKKNSFCFSRLIFDKFSPTNNKIKSRRQLLFSSPKIKPFNNPNLFKLFFDKQKTYDKLSKYAIPTISLDKISLNNIKQTCKKLTNLVNNFTGAKDFNSDIIMKDRFGAGGNHVYKFKANNAKKMLTVMEKNPSVSFIIQPFAKFDKGFSYHNHFASTDIRFIYLKNKIILSYVRIAKNKDFRCNAHQGGTTVYLSFKTIPSALIMKANLISKILNQSTSLYSLDFIISNNGNSYLLEGNTGPGLNWDPFLIEDKIKSKKLIRLVVKELSLRVKKQISTHYLPSTLITKSIVNYPNYTDNFTNTLLNN